MFHQCDRDLPDSAYRQRPHTRRPSLTDRSVVFASRPAALAAADTLADLHPVRDSCHGNKADCSSWDVPGKMVHGVRVDSGAPKETTQAASCLTANVPRGPQSPVPRTRSAADSCNRTSTLSARPRQRCLVKSCSFVSFSFSFAAGLLLAASADRSIRTPAPVHRTARGRSRVARWSGQHRSTAASHQNTGGNSFTASTLETMRPPVFTIWHGTRIIVFTNVRNSLQGVEK